VDAEELRRRLERALERDDPEELETLAGRIGLDAADARFAEIAAAQLARHRNARVRGEALAALGHLARRFGNLDRRRVQRLVENGLHARHEYVRERAESAASDLETYLGWRFERPTS
jgi:hypothetical protein